MFFCIGESKNENCATGAGETVEEAISNWSTSGDNWEDIIEEFRACCPDILQGQKLNIELECPPPIIKIL